MRLDELGRAVGRAVVERHDAVDVRRHVLEPGAEVAALVAKLQQREQPPPAATPSERRGVPHGGRIVGRGAPAVTLLESPAMSLRVLFTNHRMAGRGGTQMWIRDVAEALLERGHRPVVWSPVLGESAAALRARGVPVVDELDRIAEPPDLIHGHHLLETAAALSHFPGVPALFVCHGWLPWQERPPRLPRIRRYLAVDRLRRERLVSESGIPPGPGRGLPQLRRPAPLPCRLAATRGFRETPAIVARSPPLQSDRLAGSGAGGSRRLPPARAGAAAGGGRRGRQRHRCPRAAARRGRPGLRARARGARGDGGRRGGGALRRRGQRTAGHARQLRRPRRPELRRRRAARPPRRRGARRRGEALRRRGGRRGLPSRAAELLARPGGGTADRHLPARSWPSRRPPHPPPWTAPRQRKEGPWPDS